MKPSIPYPYIINDVVLPLYFSRDIFINPKTSSIGALIVVITS